MRSEEPQRGKKALPGKSPLERTKPPLKGDAWSCFWQRSTTLNQLTGHSESTTFPQRRMPVLAEGLLFVGCVEEPFVDFVIESFHVTLGMPDRAEPKLGIKGMGIPGHQIPSPQIL